MTFLTGKNAYFNLDTVGGSPTDLSAYTDTTDPQFSVDSHESTVYQPGVAGPAKSYVVGLRDGTFSNGGPWDPALDAHMAAIMAAPVLVTFVVGPQGSTGGQTKYTGECIVTQYSGAIPVGNLVRWTASYQVSGGITRTTF